MSKWIPASVEPENDGEYLVTWKGIMRTRICVLKFAKDLYEVDEYDFPDDKGIAGWYDYSSEVGYYPVDDVLAWMELPEPYEEEK